MFPPAGPQAQQKRRHTVWPHWLTYWLTHSLTARGKIDYIKDLYKLIEFQPIVIIKRKDNAINDRICPGTLRSTQGEEDHTTTPIHFQWKQQHHTQYTMSHWVPREMLKRTLRATTIIITHPNPQIALVSGFRGTRQRPLYCDDGNDDEDEDLFAILSFHLCHRTIHFTLVSAAAVVSFNRTRVWFNPIAREHY